MKTLYYKRHKGIKLIAKRADFKHLHALEKAIDVLQIISPKFFNKTKKIKAILILNTKKFDTACAYFDEGIIIFSVKSLIEQPVFWNAGILVHENEHLLAPRSARNNYLLSETMATERQLEFFLEAGDKLYYDFIHPETGGAKRFKMLTRNQKKKGKKTIDFDDSLADAPEDYCKMNEIVKDLAGKKYKLIRYER